jgi:hypothetical protein
MSFDELHREVFGSSSEGLDPNYLLRTATQFEIKMFRHISESEFTFMLCEMHAWTDSTSIAEHEAVRVHLVHCFFVAFEPTKRIEGQWILEEGGISVHTFEMKNDGDIWRNDNSGRQSEGGLISIELCIEGESREEIRSAECHEGEKEEPAAINGAGVRRRIASLKQAAEKGNSSLVVESLSSSSEGKASTSSLNL